MCIFTDFTYCWKKYFKRLLLSQAVLLDIGEWEKIAHTSKYKFSYDTGTLYSILDLSNQQIKRPNSSPEQSANQSLKLKTWEIMKSNLET